MAVIDQNTKVNVGILLTILGLGAGAIWKMGNVDARLGGIEDAVHKLADRMEVYVPRAEYEARMRFVDARLDHIEKTLDALRGASGK